MPPRVEPRVRGLRWNPSLARYIDERGRIVSRDAVRRALDASLVGAHAEARRLAEQLASGDVSLMEWERAMRVLIKDVHLWSAAGSVGGWAQLGAAEYGRVGAAVRDQYEFLYQFAREIASGQQKLTGVAARATLYVEAGRTTSEAQQAASDVDAGLDEERNVLGRADHCGECPAWTARQWLPHGTIPLPGNRLCQKRCKCRIERRMSDERRAELAAERRGFRSRRRRPAETTPARRAEAAAEAAAAQPTSPRRPAGRSARRR